MEHNHFDDQEDLEFDLDIPEEDYFEPQEKTYPSIDEIPIHDYAPPVYDDD